MKRDIQSAVRGEYARSRGGDRTATYTRRRRGVERADEGSGARPGSGLLLEK